MVLAKSGLVPPLEIAPLGPRPLKALKGLNDRKELRRWDSEPCLASVLSYLLLGRSVTRGISLIMTTGAPRITRVMLTLTILIVATPLTLSLVVLSRIRCTGDHPFGHGNYVFLEHGILVSPLEQHINRLGGMQRQGIKKIGVRANSLLHYQQDRVWAHDIELEDRNPETLQKIRNGLRSPHLDVEEIGNALPSLDRAHILSDEILIQTSEREYCTRS